MTVLVRSSVVPYTAEAMYNLINDVKSYAEFLPYCSGGKVIEQDDSHMVATIELCAAGICKSFTTHNVLYPYHRVEMQHMDGPFKHLHGAWTFTDLPEGGCKVELTLDFEVHRSLSGIFFGQLYKKVADELVKSFHDRAHVLHQQQ